MFHFQAVVTGNEILGKEGNTLSTRIACLKMDRLPIEMFVTSMKTV